MSSGNQTPFTNGQLPEFPPMPTVTLYRDQLEWFRAEYQRLMEFMAFVVGKPIEQVAPIDVGAWVVRNYVEADADASEMPLWMKQEGAFVLALGGNHDDQRGAENG